MITYDKNNLEKLKTLATASPESMQAFNELSRLAFGDGAIPARTKELIGLGVAISKQCTYCIDLHSKKAQAMGVTDQEFAEVAMVAAAIGAGAAITHATHAL